MANNAKLFNGTQLTEFVLAYGKDYPEHAVFDSWDRNNYREVIDGVAYVGAMFGLSFHTDCLISSLGRAELSDYLDNVTVTNPHIWFYDPKNGYYGRRSFAGLWKVCTQSIDVSIPGILRVTTRLELDSLTPYRNRQITVN